MNYYHLGSPVRLFSKPDNRVGLKPSWWAKISTSKPKCTYYFGSFNNKSEAIEALPGYIEDLRAEQAQGIFAEIKQENPELLTINEE